MNLGKLANPDVRMEELNYVGKGLWAKLSFKDRQTLTFREKFHIRRQSYYRSPSR